LEEEKSGKIAFQKGSFLVLPMLFEAVYVMME